MKITTKQVADKVRELAEASPACRYHSLEGSNVAGDCSNGSVGCIVGQAVTALIPDFDWDGLRESDADIVVSSPEFEYDNKWVGWLVSVQTSQDAGQRWGKAVIDADRKFNLC